jgi:hypothetical protein
MQTDYGGTKMKKRIAAVLGIAGVSLAVVTAAPAAVAPGPLTGPLISIETAAAQKEGNGSASKVGDRTADLFSSILVPVLFVVIGAFALVALAKREVGMAVSAVAIGLIAGLFLLAPEQVETTFRSVYSSIFG